MTNRRNALKALAAWNAVAAAAAQPERAESDRAYSLRLLGRIAEPVLANLARGTLRRNMPVECVAGAEADRRKYTHLEALGRLLAGIAPWLEADLDNTGPTAAAERELQQRYRGLAREAIRMAADPKSPDFLNYSAGSQPVVDCGFLAQAVLRAPNQLWSKLDAATQRNLAAALTSSRGITPGYNNWLLFSAMVETALASMGEKWDAMRVDYAVRKHQEWYVGDGLYGDGPRFHWDYYNSYVIQPMLLDTLRGLAPHSKQWNAALPDAMARARRYAAIQERLIAPDGSFPAIGRSITYRCGAFHLLAQMALLGELPAGVSGAQARAAMTAAMRKPMEAPGTFDSDGWLQIGFCGHQPHLGETYISTGSLYLCSTALLPLGRGPEDAYWTTPAEDWTSRRIWGGKDMAADHAI
jgi:hypothetical protein